MSVGTPRPMFPAYLPSTMKSWPLGCKGILFDIDNTLVHHGDDSTPEVDALFRHIHSLGLKTLLLSDYSAARIERFNRNIRTLFIAEAGKPDLAAYRRACAMLGLPPEQVVCVGDQLFRISAARTAPAGQHSGGFHPSARMRRTMAKRVLEKVILWFYHRDPAPPGPFGRHRKVRQLHVL